MTAPRRLRLGFILHGVGRTWEDWRHPDRDVGASTDFALYARQAQTAERGKFDFLSWPTACRSMRSPAPTT